MVPFVCRQMLRSSNWKCQNIFDVLKLLRKYGISSTLSVVIRARSLRVCFFSLRFLLSVSSTLFLTLSRVAVCYKCLQQVSKCTYIVQHCDMKPIEDQKCTSTPAYTEYWAEMGGQS